MILPTTWVAPEAQRQILEKKNCRVYLRSASMVDFVDDVLREAPTVSAITVPELDDLFPGY